MFKPILLPLFALLVCAPGPAAARTASSQDIEIKVSLESLMEKRLETVLRKILASDDVSVVVNAELLAEASRPDVEVLPGVTVKKVPASPAPMEMPASLVKRITVSVFVPHASTDESMALAKETVAHLVGLKPERGDALNVERLPAPTPPPAPPAGAPGAPASRLNRFLDQALQPTVLLLLAWLLAAVAGLTLIARRFFDPFVGALRDAAQHLSRGAAEGAAAGAAEREAEKAEAVAAAAPGAEASDRKLPFSTVRESDLPALEMLLLDQNEAASAVVVQYLSPALASRVLASMTPQKRETVLSYMSSPALLDPGDVRRIEEAVMSKLDYILGGEDKLVGLIEQAPFSMQGDILGILRRRDPELVKRLEKRVVVLDDIALLEPDDLTALNRAANVRAMAIVLKFMPNVRDAVLPKLTGGLGEWLSQETELIGDVSPAVKDAEMRRVHQALVRLVREGKIALRKDRLAAPPPDGAALAADGPADAGPEGGRDVVSPPELEAGGEGAFGGMN